MLPFIFNLPPEFESLGIMLILLSHHPLCNIRVYSIKRLVIEVKSWVRGGKLLGRLVERSFLIEET